jgi:hypothetical protein
MKKLTWWFRIVGGFYFLLAIMNLYGTLVDPAYFKQILPYADNELAVKAFVTGWSPFAFEILGLGTFMLWASRNAGKYLGAVWLIVWLELLHGVVDDVYLIANGFNAAEYIPFIVIHVIIIVTGVLFARQAQAPATTTVQAAKSKRQFSS